MALSFGRQTSKETIQETTKNLRSSFTEGSSKIFGSVKKGFFDGISSTFDQVVNIVGSTEEEGGDQQKTPSNSETVRSGSKEGASSTPSTTSSKPKPPKPPAPVSRQKSSGSNGSIKKTLDSQGSEDQSDQVKSSSKPPLKRRNTNPFMEDYEPTAAEADLPSTVVAEVYQMVSALYSDKDQEESQDQHKEKEAPKRDVKKVSHDDGDSEGTEGCDDVANINDFDHEGQITEESSEIGTDNAARECSDFMKTFVDKVFESSAEITPSYKSKFCELSQNGFGRLWFAENITSKKTGQMTKIADETFYALIQFFTIVLFECNESEDYGAAKSLMNACFVFYCESDPAKGSSQKQFLYSFLKDLPIWHSPKFWNAAYFYALQHERASQNGNSEDDKTNEMSFKQLGLITHYMRLLGLSKDQCLEYIRRQSTTANLTPEQVKQLKQKMEKWVEGSDPSEDEGSGAMWFISQKAKAVNAAARLLKDGFSFRGALKSDH